MKKLAFQSEADTDIAPKGAGVSYSTWLSLTLNLTDYFTILTLNTTQKSGERLPTLAPPIIPPFIAGSYRILPDLRSPPFRSDFGP
jgi:hypothetical protein